LQDLKVGRQRGYVNVQPEGPPDDRGDAADPPDEESGGVTNATGSAPSPPVPPVVPSAAPSGPEATPISNSSSSSSSTSSSSSRSEPEPMVPGSAAGSAPRSAGRESDDESLLDMAHRGISSAAAERARDRDARQLPADKRQRTEPVPSTHRSGAGKVFQIDLRKTGGQKQCSPMVRRATHATSFPVCAPRSHER